MKRITWLGALLIGGWLLPAYSDTAFVDFEHQWVFPAKLGELPFASSAIYESTDRGYSILYRADSTLEAEVSVFTLDRTSIPDGCKGAGIDWVMNSVEDELKLQKRHREITGLKKRGSTEVPKKGNIRFRSQAFQYADVTADPVQKIRVAYVTGWKGQYVQLQLTFDRSKSIEARRMADPMIAQLIAALQTKNNEQEMLMASCSSFLNDPAGPGGRVAARHIIAKAQTMGDLNVYTHLFVWPDGYRKPKNTDLLIAAYFAGMLQVVVPQQLNEGGEVEAFIAMLHAYEVMRSNDQIAAIPELDQWAATPDKNALFEQLLIAE